MKTIGIKLADGTFYPVLEEGTPKQRMLDLTTAKDNQTKVQIDLYRSETGTMDDAEYVDTLEVTKLNPHPNGEPELHLSVELDENNNLTAAVVDPETGKKSETEVNLVSRTEAERAAPADFAITDNEESVEDAANGIIADHHTSDSAEETTFSPEELPDIDSNALEDMPFAFDSSEPHAASEISEAAKGDEPETEEFTGALPDFSDLDDDIPVEDTTLESVNFSNDADSTVQTDTTTIEEPSEADIDNFSTQDFSLPDFDSDSDETTVADDSTFADETTVADDTTFAADDPFGASESVPDDNTFAADTDLPDFGDDFGITSNSSSKDETETDLSGFDLPDFGDLDDPAPSSDFSSSASSAGAMDFSDLYDKETIAGEHASLYDEDEEEKKTRAPVIICIVCAIICVIATILLLFVVPSKYNLIASRNTNGVSILDRFFSKDKKTAVEKTVEVPKTEETTVIDVKPVQKNEPAPEAVEDKIIIAPEPEKVVPKPKPVETKTPEIIKKTADVQYHIKWGDTLWDISESYYKTPWKYPRIADYNKIRNPDLIISGTDILIPAE